MTLGLQLRHFTGQYLVAGCLAAVATCAAASDGTPVVLEVPAGNYIAWRAPADGVVTYRCGPSVAVPVTPIWSIVGAKATLGAAGESQRADYVSPPATWTASDGSSVTGMQVMRVTSGPDQMYDQLVIANPASGAGGLLSGVTYIQRIVQSGGGVPETACSSDTFGKQVSSQYQATYVFWKPN